MKRSMQANTFSPYKKAKVTIVPNEEWKFKIRTTHTRYMTFGPNKEPMAFVDSVLEIRNGAHVWYWEPSHAEDWDERNLTFILTEPVSHEEKEARRARALSTSRSSDACCRTERPRGEENWVVVTAFGSMIFPSKTDKSKLVEVQMHASSLAGVYWTPEWLLIRRDDDPESLDALLRRTPENQLAMLLDTSVYGDGYFGAPLQQCWSRLEGYRADELTSAELYPKKEKRAARRDKKVTEEQIGKRIVQPVWAKVAPQQHVAAIVQVFSPQNGPLLSVGEISRTPRGNQVCHIATAYHWESGSLFSVVVPFSVPENPNLPQPH